MTTPPKLSFACPLPRTALKGPERSKFCEQCGHHVHNISALGVEQRRTILERARTERVCGSYLVRLSGELVTPEAPLSPIERRSIKQFGLAALSAGALAIAAGCVTPATEPAPASPPPPPPQPTAAIANASKEEEVVLLTGFIVSETPRLPEKQGSKGK